MSMVSNNEIVSIALAANHRYMPGLQATMASMLLFASEKDRLRFHIFADGLTNDDCRSLSALAERFGCVCPLEFHYPDMSRIKSLFSPYNNSHAPFLRLFLCEYLQEDWVLYADVDTLWFSDVCRLWDERDNDVSLLWCRDLPSIAHGVREYSVCWNPRFDVERYACSGVMLMNLRRMRDKKFVDQCSSFAKKWGTPFFVDQDILNAVCFDDAKLLPQYWDLMMPDREARKGCVVHFNGIGKMFNGPFVGWRPLYWMWHRFYLDVIQKAPETPVCGRVKGAIFWLMGGIYPHRYLVRLFTWPFAMRWTDQIQRTLFFAWLWRHATWVGKWSA